MLVDQRRTQRVDGGGGGVSLLRGPTTFSEVQSVFSEKILVIFCQRGGALTKGSMFASVVL